MSIFRVTLVAAILTACASQAPAPAPPPERRTAMLLPVNAVSLVEVKDAVRASRYDLTGNDHATYAEVPAELERDGLGFFRLRARGQATFSVAFFGGNGNVVERRQVTVANPVLLGRFREVERLLARIEGLEIRLQEDRVLLDGALTNADTLVADMDRLLKVQEAYRDIVYNLVAIAPSVYEACRKRMEADLHAAFGGQAVAVRWVQGTYLLEGAVASAEDRDRAEAIVQTHLPVMMGSVAIRDNVLLQGAKKFSIRNFLRVTGQDRAPASR